MNQAANPDERVFEAWAAFRAAVLPPDAGLVQIQEMRRAFYGGAWAMFCLVSDAASGTEAEGVAALDRFKLEMERFAVLLQAGLV